MRSKAGYCVHSQLANLSRIEEPHTDSPWKRWILKARWVSYHFNSSWVLRCVFFLCEKSLKVFASGQSNVRSGNSTTTSCVMIANILNTLIHVDNSKQRSRPISRLSEGRKIHALSYNLITRIPWVHVGAHHSTRSHRGSRAHVRLPRSENFQQNFPQKIHRNTHDEGK